MTDSGEDAPRLGHPVKTDSLLTTWLEARLGSAWPAVGRDLVRFGQRVVDEVEALGRAAEADPPRLVDVDAWGGPVGRVETSLAWRRLDEVAAEEGLVALAYAPKRGRAARLHQMAKIYVYAAASAIHTCPLAMADGAARVLETHKAGNAGARAFQLLTTRDASRFWTSGQWMTERQGGSDVSGTTTVARAAGKEWTLHGEKWFASAVTAPMALSLARVEEDGHADEELSLFLARPWGRDGSPQGVRVVRLKDKLGTRALPTAELVLDGCRAHLVGRRGRGVSQVAALLNITRVHNAVNAASYLRRAVALAVDHAGRRKAFGRVLAEHPLHAATLRRLEAEWAASFALAFRAAELQGAVEADDATAAERAALRLLTPLAKLYTGKQAVATVSEAMECIGGVAYVESSGFPRLLRDAQVLPIWEGTTNVLALDALRAIRKDAALVPFLDDARAALKDADAPRLRAACDAVGVRLDSLSSEAAALPEERARDVAYRLAETYAAAWLLHHAAWCLRGGVDAKEHVARALEWCQAAGLLKDSAPATRRRGRARGG